MPKIKMMHASSGLVLTTIKSPLEGHVGILASRPIKSLACAEAHIHSEDGKDGKA